MTAIAQTYDWAKQIGSLNPTDFIMPTANTIDASGNYIVLSNFMGTYDMDPGIGTVNLTGNQNGQDIAIQKFSSTGSLLWAKGILSSNAYQESAAIGADASGNIYIAGTFDAPVDFDPGTAVNLVSPVGGTDFFVLKLNSSGNFVWVRTFGAVSTQPRALCLTVSSGNSIIIGGDFDGTLDFDPGNGVVNKTASFQDGYLLSLSDAGNFNWVQTFESSAYTAVEKVSSDDMGSIFISGNFIGTTDFDPGLGLDTITSLNAASFGGDIFVARLTSAGNYLWAKRIGGNDDELVTSIRCDKNGNILAAGQFYGTVDFDPNLGVADLQADLQYGDAFITKLSATGNYLWAKQITGTDEEYIGNIDLDTLGFVYSTGYFFGTADFDPDTASQILTAVGSSVDGFVLKLTANGNFVRVNQLQSNGADEGGFLIALDSATNIYSSGLFGGTVDFDPQNTVQNISPISPSLDVYYFKWNQCIPSQTVINATGCTYVLNGQTYSGNGSYTQLFTSATGCDSIITLNLSGSSTNTYISPTVCNTNYILNGQTYTASGNYVQYYTNQASCDSNIYINLTIGAQSFNTIQITACDFFMTDQGFYTQTGIYNETYTNASGCDSNLTIVLTVNNSQTNFVNLNSCGSYLFNNNLLTSSGQYTANFLGANGCDSSVTLNLTITPTVNSNVTLNGNTLTTAAGAPATYQWVNCPTYIPISGATAQSFVPSVSGDYAVIISSGACTDTSACTNVVVTSLADYTSIRNIVRIHPNPTSDYCTVTLEKGFNRAQAQLTTISGQVLQTIELYKNRNASIDLSQYSSGVYILEVIADGEKANFKLVKQ